jgi:nitrate/TMAO reductase-like tetraheme cytochrome c subunit
MKKWILALPFGLAVVAGLLFLGSSSALAEDENGCLTCHGNPTFTKTDASGRVISLYVNKELVNVAAHRFIDCTTCHGDSPHNGGSPLTKLSLAEKCGQCHKYEYTQHINSIHGEQLQQGNSDVATCVDCHSPTQNPHDIIRVLEYNAPTFKKNISQTCARCHEDPQLMANYGVVERVYESYMRSFHGKAIKLGTYEVTQIDQATCTNCHGVHDIKSVTDPESPVAGLDSLAQTCETCHKGAGTEFAKGFLGHKEASPSHIAPVYYAEKFFSGLLVTVLSVGAVIVVSSGVRYGINRWRD